MRLERPEEGAGRRKPPLAQASPVKVSERQGLALRGIATQLELCRRYPWEFFSFVMPNPEEPSGRMVCRPHQQLIMEFILHHRRAVIRCPTDTGKTQALVGLLLWVLGHDPNLSSFWLSKTADLASRPVGAVRTLLEDPVVNARVRAIFPHLKKSSRADEGERWGTKALTVERDAGSIDPSILAIGLDTSAQGKKVKVIIADDVLDMDNSLSDDMRRKTHREFESRALSRIVPSTKDFETLLVVSNVPWHPKDLTFTLEADGWPTLHMDIEGNIALRNIAEDFDTDLVRPSKFRSEEWYRLTAHDPDPEEVVPLVPERWSRERIEEKRSGALGQKESPGEFARSRMSNPRSDEDARCKDSWIDGCKKNGVGLTLVDAWNEKHRLYDPQALVFTGVDLGFGQEAVSGSSTVFVTFALLPDMRRVLLDVYGEKGMSGPAALDRGITTHDRFDSMLNVESNAGQKFFREFARRERKALRIRSHYTTAANKRSVQFGVETVFDEFESGLWVIPSNKDGTVAPEVRKLIDGCLFYQPPPAHTDDYLMAMWIAQYAAIRYGSRGRFLVGGDETTSKDPRTKRPKAIRQTNPKGYSFGRGSGSF